MIDSRLAPQLWRIARADLEKLSRHEDPQLDAEHEARHDSAILRRLLVDQTLIRCWKSCGMKAQPRVAGIDLLKVIGKTDRSSITLASAGGAQRGGAFVGGALMVEGSDLPTPPSSVRTSWPLRNWLTSPSVIALGTPVRRLDIVKYVANKLGGVHFDEMRNPQKDAAFIALDRARAMVLQLSMDSVYFEILSMRQALTASKDIMEFFQLEHIESHAFTI